MHTTISGLLHFVDYKATTNFQTETSSLVFELFKLKMALTKTHFL